MGGVPGAAAGWLLGGTGPGRAGTQALLLQTHVALSRRPHREAAALRSSRAQQIVLFH